MKTPEQATTKVPWHRISGLRWPERLFVRLAQLVLHRAVRITGAEHLAAAPSPAVYVLNHNSYWETLAVYLALLAFSRGRKVSFYADWMFWHIPFAGWLLRCSRSIPVYTKRARFRFVQRRKAQEETGALLPGLEALRAGRSVALFPEGKANRNQRFLRRARLGAAILVLRAAVPVVPIGLSLRSPKRGRPRLVVHASAALRFSPATRRLIARYRSGDTSRTAELAAAKAVRSEIMLRLAALSGKAYRYIPASPVIISTVGGPISGVACAPLV